ncbi:geranylgeranyl pyrophosphate synthase-like isoform X2 [Stylophora pistillata]|uniref:Geranylgeranyl pyrophosphate synthase n=1 Tax=Stylophora pistillata TaxID=50429 RepID=A0A2B4RHZ4_STYPI|nr:geranylgeranyl pyrophosphate synthase-like isoform X2 [Stylophora pistillata]PFX17231.1 Geranylgeranyl pyrophosphate synthase [Stylophora pistillata]
MSSTSTDPSSMQEKILLEPYSYVLKVPGKQVREKLIQAFNFWLRIPEDKLSVIAEVVKMLHNSSLLIDDIEDNSKLRRGIPVAHQIYGVANTINSANYMYFKALDKVLSLNHPDCINIFTEELLELHRGQGMDIYWRDSYTCPSEDEYHEMVKKKTGGLFRLAVRLMQTFSENTSNFVPLLDTLALFFQIRDDYANLLSEEYKENKSFCEDLTEGKFSFPIIHAIRSDSESTRILNILRQRTTDVDLKKYFVDCLEEIGSFAYTKVILKQMEEKSQALIADLGGNPQLSAIVQQLAKLYS